MRNLNAYGTLADIKTRKVGTAQQGHVLKRKYKRIYPVVVGFSTPQGSRGLFVDSNVHNFTLR